MLATGGDGDEMDPATRRVDSDRAMIGTTQCYRESACAKKIGGEDGGVLRRHAPATLGEGSPVASGYAASGIIETTAFDRSMWFCESHSSLRCRVSRSIG